LACDRIDPVLAFRRDDPGRDDEPWRDLGFEGFEAARAAAAAAAAVAGGGLLRLREGVVGYPISGVGIVEEK
jgi:hypothetical protein